MMRRFVLALGLILAALPVLPSKAAEVVATAPDWQTFAAAAAATGYADPVTHQPIAQGPLPDGGSWFWNAVGTVSVPTGATTTCPAPGGGTVSCPEMQTLPGVWTRARFNGIAKDLPTLMQTWRSMGITIYQQLPLGTGGALCWSSDGATCGPAYIATVGLIQ